MHTREFPVLDEADEPLVDRLAAGLGDDAARVLAYLLARERFADAGDPEPTTRLAVRIGTDLNRETVATALNRLTDRDLLATTTLRTSARGRPPNAWRPVAPESETTDRVYATHGDRLAAQAAAVAAAIGAGSESEREVGSGTESAGRSNGITDARNADGNGGSDGDDENGVSESLRLGLNWEPNGLHAPFFAARAAGQYDRGDLSVEIGANRGSGAAISGVVDGESDVALAGAATVVRARREGTPVVPLALCFQRAMTTLYTTRAAFGGPFERVHQLRGKRVGTSSRSETGLLGRLFLAQAGVLDEVTVVDIAGEERAALREDLADVVTGSFADPRRLEREGETVDALTVADQFPMYGPALVTTETTLRTRRSALEAFLAGTTAGWTEAVSNPTEAVRAIDGRGGTGRYASLDDAGRDGSSDSEGKTHSGGLDRERRTFERAVREFGASARVENHGWGWHDRGGWQRLETALGQVDLV
jgi:ABC-type nitrate/sulfonate/bicarbonate transport system substrate-binding protein